LYGVVGWKECTAAHCRLLTGNPAGGLLALQAANRVAGRHHHAMWDKAGLEFGDD